jgi:hypothetical protein
MPSRPRSPAASAPAGSAGERLVSSRAAGAAVGAPRTGSAARAAGPRGGSIASSRPTRSWMACSSGVSAVALPASADAAVGAPSAAVEWSAAGASRSRVRTSLGARAARGLIVISVSPHRARRRGRARWRRGGGSDRRAPGTTRRRSGRRARARCRAPGWRPGCRRRATTAPGPGGGATAPRGSGSRAAASRGARPGARRATRRRARRPRAARVNGVPVTRGRPRTAAPRCGACTVAWWSGRWPGWRLPRSSTCALQTVQTRTLPWREEIHGRYQVPSSAA